MNLSNFSKGLQPLGRILNFSSEGWTVWDCAPLYHAGKIHVFFTRWRNSEEGRGPDAQWYLGSEIVHAVADEMLGPYEIKEVVLKGDGGDGAWDASGVINPKICQVGEKFALLYTGCRGMRHDTQAIGLLVADSPDGPWTKVSADAPLIAPDTDADAFDQYLCNNPTMLAQPDGSVWIYYKGRSRTSENKGGPMRIGLAIADQLEGPYTKYSGNPVIDFAPISFEDPFVWRKGADHYMLASELGNSHCLIEPNGGLLFHSQNGIDWSEPVQGYPSAKRLFGTQQRLEEPNLLFQNGVPTHLFTTLGECKSDPAYSGFVFQIARETGLEF